MRLGVALDLYLRIHKISAREFARVIGVSPPTISRFSSGEIGTTWLDEDGEWQPPEERQL
jgi:transcriptional regulator with XRE-family HTH domain